MSSFLSATALMRMIVARCAGARSALRHGLSSYSLEPCRQEMGVPGKPPEPDEPVRLHVLVVAVLISAPRHALPALESRCFVHTFARSMHCNYTGISLSFSGPGSQA